MHRYSVDIGMVVKVVMCEYFTRLFFFVYKGGRSEG